MMDVSDGLLIDAARLGEASGLAIEIDHVPMSDALVALRGCSVEARLAAATAGDDYVLLAGLPADTPAPEGWLAVGRCCAGQGLRLKLDGALQPLPDRLGWMHG
jgi:thiamine-monophosphate kinase